MRNHGKRTPKDDIIDMIESDSEVSFDDDAVEVLHRCTAADLFKLQTMFRLAFEAGKQSERENQAVDLK